MGYSLWGRKESDMTERLYLGKQIKQTTIFVHSAHLPHVTEQRLTKQEDIDSLW